MFNEVTVAQLCSLYLENTETVRIWNVEEEKTVYEGTFRDAQYSEHAYVPVGSFGVEDGIICINI